MNINLTLLGQMIAFTIFIWFCFKYVWPPLIAAMEARQKKIAAGLRDAEEAAETLKQAEEKAVGIIDEAKQQAGQLIEQANRRAAQLIDEAKTQAQQEGERIKSVAEADIVQSAHQAKEALRREVAAIALAGAEKILHGSIDANQHSKLLQQLATEL